MSSEMDSLLKVQEDSLQLLHDNKKEWEHAYAGYASSISKNIEVIKGKKSNFHQWYPLYLYTNATESMKANQFQLRCKGKKVGRIVVNGERVTLDVSEESQAHKLFKYQCDWKNTDWLSPEAKQFREFFSNQSSNYDKKDEAFYESMILTEMEKKDKETKFQGTFSGIQPVKIADVSRFQLPTAITASGKKPLRYNLGGGGIDILARVGKGNPALSVFELKKIDAKESPQEVIEQGLAYTVFLRELLRSKSGLQWYKLFGYTGELPNKLKINCVALMGGGKLNNPPLFSGEKLSIEQDEIHLHHMFYKETNDGVEAETSLLSGGKCK